MKDQIRQVIKEQGHLSVDVDTLGDDADLYQAGMTSHASVNVMIALEDTFDIEFLDSMLKRSVFEIGRLDRRGADRGRGAGMSATTAPVDAALIDAVRRIAADVAGPNADDVDRKARFPAEAVAALREERAFSALDPDRARRRRRLARGDRQILLRARAPLRRQRHGLRDAPDPDRLHGRPPRRGRPLVRRLPARDRRRAAAGRLDHLRGRHRRRHGQVRGLGLGARRGRQRELREAGADRLLRPDRRRLPDHRAPLPRRRARRPGPGRVAARADGDGAAGHLGPDGDARHLLARLHRQGRLRGRADPAGSLRDDLGRDDDPDLPHLLVPRLARDRHRRLRPLAGLRPASAKRKPGEPLPIAAKPLAS